MSQTQGIVGWKMKLLVVEPLLIPLYINTLAASTAISPSQQTIPLVSQILERETHVLV